MRPSTEPTIARSRRASSPVTLVAVVLALAGCRSVPVGSDEKARGDDDATISAVPAPDRAATTTSTAPPRRIVAIGDLHGDLEATRAALRLAGLIDDRDRWRGGDTILVQTGDQLDRGDDEREILELFDRLELEATAAGGEVHVLNGNHELMNAAGDFRYVTEGGWADFRDVDTETLDAALAAELDSIPEDKRGRVAAFMPGGPWALRLAERDVVFVNQGNVFVHGGLTPRWAEVGADQINANVERWLRQGGRPPAAVTDPEGPVWTRAFSDRPDAGDCATLGESLAELGADRMIVGHTVHTTGVESACDGKVWMIDVGMAAHYGGSPAALEIIGDRVTVLE